MRLPDVAATQRGRDAIGPRHRVLPGAIVAAACLLVSAAPAQARAPGVTERPVSFQVQNVNRSKLPCATDGAAYPIRGHIVVTSAQLRRADAVTLYLHGVGFGEFFWRSKVAAGYDVAARSLPAGTSRS